jgi:hypothetical protein
MYIDTSTIRKADGKTYTRHLLRESYREDGKVKKRTIANLSHLPAQVLEVLRQSLKSMDSSNTQGLVGTEVSLRQGPSVGGVLTLLHVATVLGIDTALGNDRDGKLALWQVIARTLDQGSRLSAVRFARTHAVEDLLEVDPFTEDDLYGNLKWLSTNQSAIEDRLFALRYPDRLPSLYLYDVTSSYLEGECNELAAFGYNRDGKRGKRQIVVGMLCDQDGWPLTVEVFAGNTQDPQTVASQLEKLSSRFGGGKITLVGDRGMLKSKQIQDLLSRKWHYITGITKPQIRKLINDGVFELSLFDIELAEIFDGDIRYVLRKNPVRAHEMEQSRSDRLQVLENWLARRNQYLAEHPKADPLIAGRNATREADKLKISGWVNVIVHDRTLKLEVDQTALAEIAELDGCYVLQTDLTRHQASKEQIHDRYKDLTRVEQAFRISKTIDLELRPIFVRRADSTRAHAFVVMLSYWLNKHLRTAWKDFDCTVSEALSELEQLCAIEVHAKGQHAYTAIPEPRENLVSMLASIDLQLPRTINLTPTAMDTTRKINNRRK